MLRHLLVAAICFISANVSFANNTLFLPGDAFFFVRLSAEDLDSITNQDSPTFTYGDHWGGGFGCGTCGYSQLRIPLMPEIEKKHLRSAFNLMEKDLDKKSDDKGNRYALAAINVLVYNADYDWKRFGIGLQYNEDWPEETADLGITDRKHMRLESFIMWDDSRVGPLLERNWRDSKIVAKLDTLCAVPKERTYIVNEPVEMRGKRLYIVLPNRKFSDYMYPKDGVQFCIISGDKIEHSIFESQKWISK